MARTKTKHPPVQGVQIANRISCIRLIALNTTMTKEQRLSQMAFMYQDAISKLTEYYKHFEMLTLNLGD